MYGEQVAATGYDLWTLPLSGERTKSVFLQTAYDEASGTFSPDGRWIAYESNASGRNQVYVRPFPVRDGQFPISRDGGRAPRWSGDGRELFFLTPDGMLMAAGIDTTKAFAATVPQPLFRTGLTNAGSFHPYAVAKDGRRFLIPVPREIVRLYADHCGLELASDSTEVEESRFRPRRASRRLFAPRPCRADSAGGE